MKRLLCVPYRAGETVSMTVRALGLPESVGDWFGNDEDDYKAMIEAKLRLVKFGRD